MRRALVVLFALSSRGEAGRPARIPHLLKAADVGHHPACNVYACRALQWKVSGNFWRSLAAVLIGNAIYFSCVRFLPPDARHNPGSFDLGLLVDFWICLLVMGILELWYRRRHKASPPP